jgi:hypothetical protein
MPSQHPKSMYYYQYVGGRSEKAALRLDGRGRSAPNRAASSRIAARAGLGPGVVISAGNAAAMTRGGA